jgi:hypothetical protein
MRRGPRIPKQDMNGPAAGRSSFQDSSIVPRRWTISRVAA